MRVTDVASELLLAILHRAIEDDSDEMFEYLQSVLPDTIEGTWRDINWAEVSSYIAQSRSFKAGIEQLVGMAQDLLNSDVDIIDQPDPEEDFSDLED